jgi:SAM-dependent methyltransferase
MTKVTMSAGTGADAATVREYWNTRIHDAHVTPHPVGSARFFDDLEEYRFDKLDYLPRLVDFGGYRDQAVLEIGCGAGIDLARFAAGGARVVGVDLADAAIELARRHFGHRGLAGRFAVADGTHLPFAEGAVDVVYCHGVLPYAPDPSGIVRETYRVLRPGGEAVFMAYNRHSWLAWLSRGLRVGLEHSDAPVFRLVSRSELDDMLSPFAQRTIVAERFPVPSRLHRGIKGAIYNRALVPAVQAVPRRWIRRWGWHLMAFCRKPA